MPRRASKSPPVKNTPRYLEPINSHPGPGPARSDEQLLELLASTINALRKRVAEDLVEIGFRLTEAKALAGHGGWLPWLEHNFGWAERTAQRYMSVYELVAKYDIMSDLDLPMTTLVQLAAPSTPPEAVEAVVDRVEAGEKMRGADVKKVVHEAKSKSSPRPPGSGTKKRGGEKTKRHDERMKSARYKLEAFIRDYFDMAEWKALCEAIKKQLGAKHV
jgi:Protein of unknown function (DUF3102)